MREPIKVLYEDECLVVFDKPSGLLVIPSPKKEKNTLVNIVNAQYTSDGGRGQALYQCRGTGQGKLHPCHRLDRDTSGAIIFAWGKKNQRLMMEEFHKRAVKKKYITFVRGQLEKQRGEIRGTVCPRLWRAATGVTEGKKAGRRGAAEKFAVTRYEVKAVKEQFSVVDVFPKTGRTNQIRIHFRQIGHPLLGERVYAFGRDFSVKFRRLALHASELSWRHPVRKKQIKVISELPKDMKEFLEQQSPDVFLKF